MRGGLRNGSRRIRGSGRSGREAGERGGNVHRESKGTGRGSERDKRGRNGRGRGGAERMMAEIGEGKRERVGGQEWDTTKEKKDYPVLD